MDNYRSINLTEWTLVGEGGNGKTYINPSLPDHILKVNKTGLNTLEVVRHEYEVSKAVDSLGLQVPKVYEIVSVGDNYGTLSQLIKDKKSLSRLCHDQPERTAEIARIFCDKAKDFVPVVLWFFIIDHY